MSTKEQARKVAQDQANMSGEIWVIYRDVESGEFDASSLDVAGPFLENTPEKIDSFERFDPNEDRRKITSMAVSVVLNAKSSPGLFHQITAKNGNHAVVTYDSKTELWYIDGSDKGCYLSSEAVSMLEYILTRPAPSRQDGGADHIPTPAEIYAILNKAYADLAEARESVYFEEQRLSRRKQELEEQETKLRASGALDGPFTDTQRKARLFDLTTAERALLESTRQGVEEAVHKMKQAEAEKERARAILRVLELAAGINRDNHQ